ncbi:MAG: DUF2961 domain-containing protein [Propionibacteriales bacterium]|nr:DUF2961 domain-containing protein [Propionibacteriales bacterium]
MLHLHGPAVTQQLTTFDRRTGRKVIAVDPGASAGVGEIDGPGFLAKLWLTLPGWFWAHWEPERPVDQRVLSQVVIRIVVDGTVVVAAPVGDLFGVGLARAVSYASRWIGMSSGGFYLSLPAPFRESLRIEVDNHAAQPIDLFCNAIVQCRELPAGISFLHTAYGSGRLDGVAPQPLIDVTGTGRYIGCTVSMQGEARNTLTFLEAPEHVWIDTMAATPTLVGTGLEDYFLGGWYFREGAVSGPDHGVPIKDALDSSVAMYRFHDLDAYWFSQRLRMEFCNPLPAERLRPYAFSSLAFCYLDEPTPTSVPKPDELAPWYRIVDTDHQAIP